MRVTVAADAAGLRLPRHATSPAGLTDQNLPRMGERLRLRQDFDIVGLLAARCRRSWRALKKYGMFVADNGIDWAISVAPDARIPVLHEELRRVKGSDFEVVQRPGS